MKNILISPYSQQLPNGKLNPKNYPYWNELIDMLHQNEIAVIQCGVGDEIKLPNADVHLFDCPIETLCLWLHDYDLIISVDNFMQHLCWYMHKKCIVLFSRSDPKIFGHKENINLYKDEKYFNKNQFLLWTMSDYIEEAFIEPQIVLDTVLKELKS